MTVATRNTLRAWRRSPIQARKCAMVLPQYGRTALRSIARARGRKYDARGVSARAESFGEFASRPNSHFCPVVFRRMEGDGDGLGLGTGPLGAPEKARAGSSGSRRAGVRG